MVKRHVLFSHNKVLKLPFVLGRDDNRVIYCIDTVYMYKKMCLTIRLHCLIHTL